MPEVKRKKGMVNRQAVGTYQGKLHGRQSGSYGSGGTGKGERKGAKPKKAEENGELAKPDGLPKGKKDNIQCDGEVVAIGKLVPDPMNARLHPERNLQAIMESLALYGQRKPLAVRKQNLMVAAGNGTLEAAKALGWTKIACSIRPMTDAEFAGYGLADNRTAELAKWDFEVVARLDALMKEQGESRMVGWTMEEIEVLRVGVQGPDQFPEVDESIEVEHECPKCGYKFSGGKVAKKGDDDA